MDLEAFRKKVREFYRPTGFSQKMLARELGLQPTALSNKLNGTGDTSLKHTEVKQIIKTLAEWEAIATQTQAVELLELMDLRRASFTQEEWNSPPLNKLSIEDEEQPTSRPALINRAPQPAPLDIDMAVPVAPSPPLNPSQLELGGNAPQPNLPLQLTPLIGREAVLTQTLNLLRQPQVRLVTLSGSGGVGKTRVALQLAATLRADFPDGIFFISLASVTDPALVLSTIATTLGIGESGQELLASVLENYLRDKQLLLVLDNFEQVVRAAIVVKELMSHLSGLKLLITSRVLLRIYGEYEYVIPPLALPDPDLVQAGVLSLEELAGYEAVSLFVQRAQAAKADFTLTRTNAALVATICQRLDGLPLALELAAARIKVLPPDQILNRLDHRLALLNRGPQDLPARQQTLRALFDWSYDLLEAEEQKLLARLSVFVGGCELEAAREVCLEIGSLDEGSMDLFETLSELVDKSMLKLAYSENGETRFSMLDTLREYTFEKLEQSGETSILQARHYHYFVSLAEQAEAALAGNQQKGWLDRLEAEHANLRAALGWALQQAKAELALRLASLLGWFWDAHGHLSEGRQWLEQALSSQEKDKHEMASGSFSSLSYPELRAKALNAAGNLARKQNDNVRAVVLLEESLRLRQELGQPRQIAQTLNNLGVVAYHQGDLARAQAYYEKSIALKSQLNDKRSLGLSLSNLAEVVQERGEKKRAIGLFEQSLALLREVGDSQNIAAVVLNLGVAIGDEGELARATGLLSESLALLGELGDKFHLAETLESLAGLATTQSQYRLAARLLGAAHSLRQTLAATISPKSRLRYEQTFEAAKTHLAPKVWKEEWQKGQQTELAEIIGYALAQFGAS